WSFFAADNYQAAAQAYDTCVALRPDYALGYAERGRILIKQVQSTSRAESRKTLERRGLQDLDRAQALEPDEPFIHWLRADALRDLGRVSGALEALARAMELERPLARWKGQRIGEEKHHFFDTGARFAGGITQKEPGQANAWAVLAMAEFGLGRFESAARAADRALEHRPHHPRALAVRGALRQQQKQFQLALDDFNRVLADAPGIYLAAAGRAQSYFSLDQFEEAVASFDHLLTFAVSDWQRVEAHLGKARSLERLGKLEMARQALENARKIDPNSTLDETPP
ncbi:MAG TPA: tetratricopeptide repeat protein, partial [Gemmataceae bacterium]|nr:tetratricopeptide repeat protein [Gemmataceae bacterium]